MNASTPPNLGSLCPSEAFRDCIHIAIAPVLAGEDLSPGERVLLHDDRAYAGVHDDKATCAGEGKTHARNNPIGIVDPFLSSLVKAGERFWLLLFPNTITGMRHVWSHPAFKPKVPVQKEQGFATQKE